ncbi:glycosyltransferase family 4 protein [Carboxydothermus ferrireducens]|uniref:Glycosyltransferase involved in cell wall biosynthesis n=1 Tax=Carboxydothermus ferrireducens DSM 11255 TaxID=1119529 RepID=A0ABX2RAR8_9THEO|nr:glycosyltransferase family 1 protein [Carboxydothermus ferrireducens]NYE56950.1 glycosyltransferase involved in cell wall biosynthesis [Carboxydothermus ferrireducens DSM 11255]
MIQNNKQIYINSRYKTQIQTGVQRYASEIIKRISSKQFIELYPSKELPYGLGHLWEQFILPGKIRNNSLLWSPGGSGPIIYKNQVITMHDIAPVENPEWYNKYFAKWYKFLWPKLLKNAKHIISVSEFTKSRIINIYNVKPEKITVIHLGVDDKFFIDETKDEEKCEKVASKYNLPKQYLLMVSSPSPRKNIENIVKAYEKINRLINIPLVIVGKSGLSFAGKMNLDIQNNKNIIFTGYVDDEDLPYIYHNSAAFIYASLYEGFGLPVLEAMAAGTPVITSNLTSMPEIAGEFAYYVDPYDISSISEGILKVVSDINLRKKLINGGKIHAKNFSWNKTAAKTLEVLLKFA